jgi:hypothetical protein
VGDTAPVSREPKASFKAPVALRTNKAEHGLQRANLCSLNYDRIVLFDGAEFGAGERGGVAQFMIGKTARAPLQK